MKTHKNSRKNIWVRLFVGLILLLSVAAVVTGFFLKRGVSVESMHFAALTVTDMHLQWHDKLDLQIVNISFEESQRQKEDSPKDLSVLDKAIRACLFGNKIFSRIVVQEIEYKDLRAALHLEEGASFFTLKSDEFAIRSNLAIEKNILSIDIIEAASERFKSHLTGAFHLNTLDEQATGSFTANLAGSLFVKFDVTADPEQVSFQGGESEQITDITPFVDLFGLDQNIQRWITEYLTGNRYHLKSFSGNFPLKAPLVLLDTFLAEVRVEGCEYTFAPGLEAIKTEYTDVVFKKGVLGITPHNSTFYGQDGEKSWLDINFNDPDNIILTAYILTRAVANDDIMNLLKYYNIPLPFIQVAGKTDTDLTLAINLNETLVTANGRFLIDEGRVRYDKNIYDLKDAIISLEGTRVTLEQMRVSLNTLFTADISGVFNAATGSGDIDIELDDFALEAGESLLSLDETEATKPLLHYHIRPEGASIDAEASAWKLDATPLRLGAFNTPFSFAEFSGVLPRTRFSIPSRISSEVSGSFSLKNRQVDLRCDLLEYHVKDLVLKEGGIPLKIQYDKDLTIKSDKLSQWSMNNIPVSIYPSEFTFGDSVLSVISGRIKYGTFFDSSLSGSYDFLSHQGAIVLENLQIKKDAVENVLNPSDVVFVELDGTLENLLLRIPEFGLEISSGEKKSWSVNIADIGAIYDHSPVLQQYLLDKGSLKIVSENEGATYLFTAEIPYRYALLVQGDELVEQYHINGKVSDQGIEATINDDVHLVLKDELRVSSQDVSYNIPGIVELLKNFPRSAPSDSKENTGIVAKLTADNSSLVLNPARKMSADLIEVDYRNGKFSANLVYGAGHIALEHEGTNFSLIGEDLNDDFMDALIAGSEFHKGSMSVAAKGDFDDFSVVVKIEDTIMSEFALLNNILAMVDTIPALITFSLPSYSTKGLPVDSLVVGLDVKQGFGTVDTVTLESPQLGIAGTGWIDFPKKQIAMELNLITQAKKNLNKIPLLGYILAGKKKHPSITVLVSGDLANPVVEHSVFKEVATVPFSMLYRTLALPAHLVSPMFESSDGEQVQQDGEETGWETAK